MYPTALLADSNGRHLKEQTRELQGNQIQFTFTHHSPYFSSLIHDLPNIISQNPHIYAFLLFVGGNDVDSSFIPHISIPNFFYQVINICLDHHLPFFIPISPCTTTPNISPTKYEYIQALIACHLTLNIPPQPTIQPHHLLKHVPTK